jgi:carboxymethylenebutenolidase
MSETITLDAADGHRLGAYLARPDRPARGGVVVLQEIFGVNHHIKSICDRLAAAGYAALAPALFDRITPDFETGYSPDEVAHARSYIAKVDWDDMLADTKAAVDHLAAKGPVSVVGFCLGGSLAYLAAARLDNLTTAAAFYGGKIKAFAEAPPRCPVEMHFGEEDQGIPVADVEAVRAQRPECPVFLYPAGHGFNCDERASYHAASAALAWSRTMALLDAHHPAS